MSVQETVAEIIVHAKEIEDKADSKNRAWFAREMSRLSGLTDQLFRDTGGKSNQVSIHLTSAISVLRKELTGDSRIVIKSHMQGIATEARKLLP